MVVSNCDHFDRFKLNRKQKMLQLPSLKPHSKIQTQTSKQSPTGYLTPKLCYPPKKKTNQPSKQTN